MALSGPCPPFSEHFWDLLGPVWDHLEPSWSHLGTISEHLGAILESSWSHLGAILEPSQSHLGAILEPPCAILKPSRSHLGAILEPPCAILEPSWSHLGARQDQGVSIMSQSRLLWREMPQTDSKFIQDCPNFVPRASICVCSHAYMHPLYCANAMSSFAIKARVALDVYEYLCINIYIYI